MATFKQFNTNEVVLTPFHANKGFHFTGPQITASDVGIEYYQSMQGPYISGSSSNLTGITTRLDSTLVFNNIKQLYYSNYLTSSTGDSVSTASLIPGISPEYNTYVGKTTGPRFDNFLQSSQTQDRRFSRFNTSGGNGPSVISIPSKLFGEKIPPGTFNFNYTSALVPHFETQVYDDGEGNLIATSSYGGVIQSTGSVGQIFYSQGMAIFTETMGNLDQFASLVEINGVPTNNLNSASISFSSSITIQENQYKCTIRDNEYSYTTNPSSLQPSNQLSKIDNQLSSSILQNNYGENGDGGTYILNYLSGATSDGIGGTATLTIASDGTISNITTSHPGSGYKVGDQITLIMAQLSGGTQIIPNATGFIIFLLTTPDVSFIANQTGQNDIYYDFATGSYFSPYVTTIGLYNEAYQLVAVGKLAQAIPISLYTDTTFVINFDT